MNKTFAILTFLFCTTFLKAQTGYVGTGNNASNQTTETFVINSPTSAAGNRKITSVYKDSLYFYSHYPTIRFTKFTNAKNDGLPANLFWSDANGQFKKSPFSEVRINASQVLNLPIQDIYNQGFGLSKSTVSLNNFKFDIDQSVMMTVQRATDSISSIMSVVNTKATASNVYTKSQADENFLETEADPTVSAAAKSITTIQKGNWNTAFGWGNHSGLYKLISYVPVWSEILGKPSFFNGDYNSLINLPDLSTYLTGESDPIWSSEKGNYSTKAIADGLYKSITYAPTYLEITGKPTLFSGVYNDLSGKPTLFNGVYSSLTGIPATFAPSAHSHLISDVTALQSALDAKITVGASIPYSTLSGTPSLFSGAYTDLTGKPTIPTNNNQLTNGANYITSYTETDPLWTAQKSSYSTTAQATLLYRPISYVPSWSEVTSKPTFSTVATTGSYNDLSNKPAIQNDYVNTTTTTAGVATFYLTSDKTSTGTALYTNVNFVCPIINDSASNYTYGWAVSGDKKTLTVTSKVSSQTNVALIGLTVLGVPANVANGTSVQVLVKGN